MTKKVTELPAATTPLAGADILLVVQGGVSKQSPVSGLPSSGGGLTNLTEAKNTASPNAAIPVVSLSVTITETNGDIAIVPKGSGSVIAAVPNSAASGGNKRGINSVDLQTNRTAAAQVASGNFSTIVGGQQCSAGGVHSVSGGYFADASGAESIALGGQTALASAQYTTAVGGLSPSATSQYATSVGGTGNSSTATAAVTIGGQSNVADGLNSSIVGGERATTRGVTGVESRASGRFSATGDAQRERFVLRRSTTDATATVISADGGSPTSANQITLPNNGAYGFNGKLIARNASNGDCSHWRFEGTIRRGANAAATALVAAVSASVVSQDAGASTWSVSITADTTNGALAITVTGVAATNIKWVADVETVEVVG